jgi:hypothetical protein
MIGEDQAQQHSQEGKTFLHSLPGSAKGCLAASTFLLILLEAEAGQSIWFVLRSHAHVQEIQWVSPLMIFLPWWFCLWSLKQMTRLVTRYKIEGQVNRLMECIAAVPGLAYVLAVQWCALGLAVSKLK